KSRPERRDRLVTLRLDVSVARVKGLDLEDLTRLDSQNWLVPPIKREPTGLFSQNALHRRLKSCTNGREDSEDAIVMISQISLLIIATSVSFVPSCDHVYRFSQQEGHKVSEFLNSHGLSQVIGHDRVRLRFALGDFAGLDRDQPALGSTENE